MIESRERVLRSILHEEPDRVPVYEPYGVRSPTADFILGKPSVLGNMARRLIWRPGENMRSSEDFS